jgi:CelD/BcsL family acetyltransferase involved in cellulose biosynthesis
VLAAELIEDVEGLEALRAEWDRLTVACALPLTAPDWVLAWWRHLAPADAAIRAVAVREEDRLVGLAPLYAAPGAPVDYRLMAGEVSQRNGPVVEPGREWEVAEPVAAVLAAARPRPDRLVLDAVPLASPWPALLRERWPGALRPAPFRTEVQGAPTVALDRAGLLDDWLATRSANFRNQMRRMRRNLERAGGRTRAATGATLRADLEAFARLHVARWEGRGQSGVAARGTPLVEMLEAAGRQMLEGDRLRVWVVELEGAPIAVNVFLAAGGEVMFWNGGWDERHARLKPAMLVILAALEDALERGERRLDLGGGEQAYKLRFADGNDPLFWGGLTIPGPRYPVTLARTGPRRVAGAVREGVRRTVTDEQYDRLRRARAAAVPPWSRRS